MTWASRAVFCHTCDQKRERCERNFAGASRSTSGRTLASASSLEKDLKASLKTGADKAAATAVGKLLAERAAKAGIKAVVFDRGGFKYHGRIKALADGAREGGLNL